MKILLIGANGTIGQAIEAHLSQQHTVIKASKNSGDVQVDATDLASIQKMFEQTGKVDAVISAAGLPLVFKPFNEMTPQDYLFSFQGKGLGQMQIALMAQNYLNDGGSITLTSGILTDNFIKAGSAGSMVNAAIDGFVKSVALELPRGLRLNAVSPGMLKESAPIYGEFFPGFEPVPAAKVANAFARAVLGIENGKILSVV